MLKYKENGTPCSELKKNKHGEDVNLQGECESGQCIIMSGITCPEGYTPTLQPMPECTLSTSGIANDADPSSSFKGNFCSISGSGCLQLGPQVQNLMCVTDAQYNGGAPNLENPDAGGLSEANTMAYPIFFDP